MSLREKTLGEDNMCIEPYFQQTDESMYDEFEDDDYPQQLVQQSRQSKAQRLRKLLRRKQKMIKKFECIKIYCEFAEEAVSRGHKFDTRIVGIEILKQQQIGSKDPLLHQIKLQLLHQVEQKYQRQRQEVNKIRQDLRLLYRDCVNLTHFLCETVLLNNRILKLMKYPRAERAEVRQEIEQIRQNKCKPSFVVTDSFCHCFI